MHLILPVARLEFFNIKALENLKGRVQIIILLQEGIDDIG